MHFAAFAYVGESVGDPGRYYRNNVAGRYLQVQHCFGIKPCLPATLITRISTINLQKYLRHHLKSHIHRDL